MCRKIPGKSGLTMISRGFPGKSMLYVWCVDEFQVIFGYINGVEELQ